jgi:nucleotide-binding universal stress UspA family protein
MKESPYRSIAVASTFSPRFLQVLSEAIRVQKRFGAELNLIYVGERDPKTTAKFAEVFSQLNIPADTVIHYQQGDPATAILDTIKSKQIGLIVAGALEKEVILRQFLGNVARRLVREAACSVMLFTKPQTNPKPLRRLVFMAEYSEHATRAFDQTLALAAAENCECLYVVRVYTSFDAARATRRENTADDSRDARARTLDEEEAALEQFILAAGPTEVPMEARCIRGNTGFAAMDFVHSVEADLLVVPLDPELAPGSELPPRVAWVTDVIPCNLWVIR